MSKKRVYAHILLDASGSMRINQENTRKAINEYISGLRDENISVRLSLTCFSNDVYGGMRLTKLRDGVKIKDSSTDLTVGEYQPNGGTPLNDAIAAVVADITTRKPREQESVTLVIMTDGEENSSKEHTKEGIKAILDQHREKDNWLVVYLGADHDAFTSAKSYGINQHHTMSFEKMGMGHTNAMRATVRGTVAFAASGATMSAAYTDAEREDSQKK